jgi:5'-nucleotidase
MHANTRILYIAHHKEITRSVPPNEEIIALVESLTGEINAKLVAPVGRTLSVWDARSTTVRLRESGIGNFVADLMRHHWPDVDIGLLCGGTIRSDTVYGPGVITKRDILNIFPFEDPAVVIRVSGEVLLRTFENAVSQVPKLEGRFPHVSGCRIIYEPGAEPGSRVRKVWVQTGLPPPYHTVKELDPTQPRPGEVELDPEKIYTVCTRHYLASGNDGYEALKDCEYVIDDEAGVLISTMIHKYFLGLKYVNAIKFKDYAVSGRVQEAVKLFKKGLVRRQLRESQGDESSNKEAQVDAKEAEEVMKRLHRRRRISTTDLIRSYGVPAEQSKDTVISLATVAPIVEGRIVSVDADGKVIYL